MKKKVVLSSNFAELRRRAELQFKQSRAHAEPPLSEVDTQKLIQELQVHQIELEMQNEELHQARIEVEAGLERYNELYDFAPVGYFTLERDGTVDQVNFAGAQLFGADRSHLVGRRLGLFVMQNDLLLFNSFLGKVFESTGKEICEVTLTRKVAGPRSAPEQFGGQYAGKISYYMVHIEAALAADGRTCRAVVLDITERMGNERSLRWLVDQKTQRTEELEALTYISATMRQERTLVTMTPLLVFQSIKALKAQTGIMALIENQSLEFSSGAGKWEAFNRSKLPEGDDLLWNIVRSGELKIFDELSSNAYDNKVNSFFGKLVNGLGACIITPFKMKNKPIGLLLLGYSNPIVFNVNQMRLITAISEMASSALHRMSATEKMELIAANSARELESIYRITSAASQSIDPTIAFKRALGIILKAFNANFGSIFLVTEGTPQIELLVVEGLPNKTYQPFKEQARKNENSPEGWVIRHNKVLLLPGSASGPKFDLNIHSEGKQVYAGFPMHGHEQVIGVLSVSRQGTQQFSEEEITLLSFISNHLGLIIENIRLFKQEEHSIILEERSRLARELHDSIIQVLFSAGLISASAQEAIIDGNLEQAASSLKQTSRLINQALVEMRLMVFELRSEEYSKIGYIAGLKHRLDLIEIQTGIKVNFKYDKLPVLNPKTEDGLYRIAMEALNNVYKHAKAENLAIKVSVSGNNLTTIIEDNGEGFDLIGVAQNGGLGLPRMNQQVMKINGSLEVKSTPGGGTRVSISVPIV